MTAIDIKVETLIEKIVDTITERGDFGAVDYAIIDKAVRSVVTAEEIKKITKEC